MRFRREPRQQPNLSQGARYCRARGGEIETAKVLAIVADPAGIPHVRFSLQIEGADDMAIEQRTLALDWFTTLYPVPASA